MPGLYLHIPFCIRKCRYCDFISFAGITGLKEYFHALKREMALAASMGAHLTFDTVFFGGGTPSIAPEGEIARVLDELHRHFCMSPNAEITLESNPGTLTREKLMEYRRAGVNRLSIGLQSASDVLLSRIGRIHTFEEFQASYRMAREAGFENINVDVMYGLPGQKMMDYLGTLETLCALSPEHISAYSLILEERTPLCCDVKAGRETLPDEDAVADMQEAGQEYLAGEGYLQYEISNYCKPGRECRHNVNYWENGEYLGLGVAAHGALRLDTGWTRLENTTLRKVYFDAIQKGELPLAQKTQIEKEEEMFETVMLGLRMTRGFALDGFEQRYGIVLSNAYPDACKKLTERGWLLLENGRAYLTPDGLNMQNTALLEFMK